jgi:steroid 5-alpha reductase family enzyme
MISSMFLRIYLQLTMATILPMPLSPSFNLLVNGCATIALQLLAFVIASCFHIDLVTDFAGCLNFVLVALLSFFLGSGTSYASAIVPTVLVILAKLYLGVYLLERVIRRGKDDRFNEIRDNTVAFLVFFILQMVWVFGTSIELILINSIVNSSTQIANSYLIAGAVIVGIGLIIQITADLHKRGFQIQNGKQDFIKTWLWSYSRHPSYFGEMLMVWGIWIIGFPVFQSDWYNVAIISPIVTMLLLLVVSGVPSCEGANSPRSKYKLEVRREYDAYKLRTSPIIPFPPIVYARLPLFVKACLFFEFPMYREKDDKRNGSEALI